MNELNLLIFRFKRDANSDTLMGEETERREGGAGPIVLTVISTDSEISPIPIPFDSNTDPSSFFRLFNFWGKY